MALAGQPADDAATLAFGPEFPLDSCECLSDAEVTTILDTHLRSSAAADRPFPRKALEYARRNVGARPLEAVKTEAVHVRQALQLPSPADPLNAPPLFVPLGAAHIVQLVPVPASND